MKLPVAVFAFVLPLAGAFAPQSQVSHRAISPDRAAAPVLEGAPNSDENASPGSTTSGIFSKPWMASAAESAKRGIAAGLLSLMLLTNVSQLLPAEMTTASGGGSTIVGEIAGSGLVFKDTLVVEQFDDPKVQGVTLYITNFQKPLTEKISKGEMFSDPSYASVSCARTGKVAIADNIALGKQGEEVFEESKSLLFKTLRVQRIYDKERNTMVYVSFNTRLDKGADGNKSRFKSSTCAININ